MGREPGWAAVATGRPPMRSPGRPPVARKEHLRLFWTAISRGATSTDAGLEAGVSQVLGTRWFRECGGVTPQSVFHVDSGRYLSFDERKQIALGRAKRTHAGFAGGEPEWFDGPAGCFAFRRAGTTLVCVLNASTTAVPLPAGDVLLSSGPLDDGLLPQDTAAWLS